MRKAVSATTLRACALGVLCAALSCAHAQTSDLRTRAGHSLGLSLLNHKYDEPGYMTLQGPKLGIDYAFTHVLQGPWPRSDESWWFRGELRHDSGRVDYRSPISGSMDDKLDRALEARAWVGRDLNLGGSVLTPAVGLGLRQHHSDLRGIASLGGAGYRRDTSHTLALLGATHKVRLSGQAQFHSTVEYMHLLRGSVDVRRSDASPLLSDLGLRQSRGHGLRLQFMRHTERWSFGPTLSYWQVDASDTAGSPPAFEPRNRTQEFGLKAAYHF